ncbi:rhomboid family intramembrane serine protease [Endozoicomonas ascidiicola]|uniref:rhomboid family intramembrane serine protease n=1 Tax=Endozoicomonas ascidiicola TaxID=1698521 RepID=UPI0008347EE1|nr:rhomboid family intramembrane serine protease [Endozoicomonas ascidiicola]
MHRALEIGGTVDLSDLSFFLYSRGIPHKITEESGQQVIWTASEEHSRVVVSIYEQWQSGELKLASAPPRVGVNAGQIFRNIPWKQLPITFLFIVACVLVGIITQMGTDWQTISWFSFVPFQVGQGYLYFGSLTMGLEQGEYWRLITPIFLHFGISHLAFNMLTLYIFGSRLEVRQGGLHLLGIIVFTGFLSNVAQFFWGGDNTIFGGFSGVVYGLMGYCMVREKIDSAWRFGLPPLYYGLMLGWLVIGYTGILGSIGFGNMANAAHTGGLVAGGLLGLVAGFLFKSKEHQA